jgi:glycosyltransferase involved in cell wall biosynthesis
VTTRGRVLVVSHAAVVDVNQDAYVELAHRGWDVSLVVPARWRNELTGELHPAVRPELQAKARKVPVALAGRPQRHVYLTRATSILRSVAPEVLFVEEEPFSASASQWARAAVRLGVPFGVQQAENLDRRLPAPVRSARRFVLDNATFVAARSESARHLALQWGARRCTFVPHHVPAWGHACSRPARPTIGFAGRLVPEKGIADLVASVRMLDREVDLLVVGDGPMRDELVAADLGRATLRLEPSRPHADMRAVYEQMSVLVLPSRTTATWVEQFGRVLIEALSCGVPVIGSDSGEIPHVIGSAGGGTIVPEGDVAALAAAITSLLDDERARRAYGDAGRRFVTASFTPEVAADRLEEELCAAVARRRLPRVALVAHAVNDGGGMERACAELVRRTSDRYAFTVVAAELGDDVRAHVDRVVRVPVPLRPIPLKFLSFFVVAGTRLRRTRHDVVHTVGAIVPNHVDLASVHFCHASHRRTTGSLAPASRPGARRLNTLWARAQALLVEQWCYRHRVHQLAAVSEAGARDIGREYPDADVVVAPNGTDVARFRPDAEGRASMRDELAATETDVVALLVGNDWDHKGLGLVIAALPSVPPSVLLWVVGRGDAARFGLQAAALGVAHRIRFLGERPDVERCYQGADVFVLPSTYESFSLVALEAAATGLPLVLSDIPLATDLITEGGGGVVVERRRDAIAHALAALANDGALRQSLGRQARAIASVRTWDRSVAVVTKVYDEVLAS